MSIRELKLARDKARDALQSATCGGDAREIANARKVFDDASAALRSAEYEQGDRVVSLDAGESAELRSLRSQTAVGRYLVAAMRGSRVEGADEDFRQAVQCAEGEIPYAAFGPPSRQFVNADAPSVAPTTIGINMDPIVPAAFADSIAAFLGIGMPQVPSGQHSIPRLTTNLTAGTQQKGGTQESTAAAFTTVNAKPKRISGRLSLRAEDLAEVGIPGFESALQANLRMVLADVLDIQLLRGTGASGQLHGLDPQLTADADPTGAQDFPTLAGELAAYVDGKFAASLADLRVIHNPTVYAVLQTKFPTNQDSVDFLQWAMRHNSEYRTNSNMTASASNIGKSIVVRSGAMVRGVTGAMAVSPVWGNLSIRDPYSDAAAATEHVTIHALVGNVMIRYPEAYGQWRIKSA